MLTNQNQSKKLQNIVKFALKSPENNTKTQVNMNVDRKIKNNFCEKYTKLVQKNREISHIIL